MPTPINVGAARGSIGLLADAMAQDVSYAVRGLRRRPGFAAIVVLTLSLGIGANATMFGIVDRLLFRPPQHIVDVDRIVQMHSRRLGSTGAQSSQPYVIYKDFLKSVPEFENVAVTTPSAVVDREYYPMGRGTGAARVAGAQVSPSFFPLLGVRPYRGRFFQENEAGDVDPQKLAVLGYRFWKRQFGGLDNAVGQTVELGSDRYTIVGVAPEGFTGIELSDVDVWIPIAAADGLRFAKSADWATTRNSQWMYVIARLKPGANPGRAEARATAVFRAGERERIAASSGRVRFDPDSLVVSLTSILPAKSARAFGLGRASTELRVSRLLGAVSLMVLLIACANVATLLLVRAMARRREIAVRLALGVTRGRLIGQLLTEGMILALLGALGALICAHVASGSIRAILLADNAWSGSAVDGRMLVYTAAAALATGILTSLIPALHSSRAEVSSALKSGSREGAVQRSRARTALLVAQAALAVVLLAGAGLFVGSLRNVARLPLGVDVDRVLAAEVQHASVGMTNADAHAMFRRFTAVAQNVPGITHAATTIGMSFGLGWGTQLSIPGRQAPAVTNNPSQYAVTPEYFDVMGIRLVSGRTFTESDRGGTPLVAVINQTTARTFWPGEDPVGQCVRVGSDTMPCTTVVGIVANARRQQLVEQPVSQIYRPLDQIPMSVTDRTVSFFGLALVARTNRKAATMAEPLRRALQEVELRAPYIQVRPLTARIDRFTRSWRLGATMFSIFGTLALILAALGLYSVVAFTIAQRQHEFGVRVALGATGGSLVRLNVGRGVAPALVGIAIGLVIVFAGGRFIQDLLFELSPRDPGVLGSVVALLLIAAILSSLIPALRAAKVDPAIVLRSE